jgi:hypothetical protein
MAESAQSKCYEMLGEALYTVGTLQTERDEAWDLIDKILKIEDDWWIGAVPANVTMSEIRALRPEIEEKRQPHDVEGS